ncbi:hypothetical protein KNJ79_16525 [Sphingopyxis indica]|uniref:hypothetical protein n=1 Tax=Sphingopyxis indica TaxID=436663 RepID=UPI0029393FEC|nr:hypothetical protein [Sphingopyxis indica]WOF42752.1 hypothetical protein KNJ79_16525 [Sphingopyxis indica]
MMLRYQRAPRAASRPELDIIFSSRKGAKNAKRLREPAKRVCRSTVRMPQRSWKWGLPARTGLFALLEHRAGNLHRFPERRRGALPSEVEAATLRFSLRSNEPLVFGQRPKFILSARQGSRRARGCG